MNFTEAARQRTFSHCLWLHKRADRDYAEWHARYAESLNAAMYAGLLDRVCEEINKREAAMEVKDA